MKKVYPAIVSALTSLFVYATPVFALPWQDDCASGPNDTVATLLGVKCVMLSLISFIVPLISLSALFVILLAGSKFILGGEDPKKFAAAKKQLTYAVVGLIGIGLSWVILVLIQQFTGANVTKIDLNVNYQP